MRVREDTQGPDGHNQKYLGNMHITNPIQLRMTPYAEKMQPWFTFLLWCLGILMFGRFVILDIWGAIVMLFTLLVGVYASLFC